MRTCVAVAAIPAFMIACTPDTTATQIEIELPAATSDEVASLAESADELVTEAQEPISTARGICVGAVTLGAALGCVTAGAACSGTTYLTVGGTAYPCLIILAVACAAVPASAAVYIQAFCPKL